MSPSISIIMPVYNAKKYVGRAIESILSQDFEHFELILINDGSTDGSDIICKEFASKDNRIIIINQKNSGTSAARNTGLDAARGKYITFCDHDDEYLPHLLRDNFELIEKNQADVLQFSINRIDSANPSHILHQILVDQSIDASDIRQKYLDIRLTENFMDVWNHFYLRETIQNIRFNSIYRHGREDLDFNIQVLKHVKKSYYFSSCIYYNHYFYKISSSNSFSPQITEDTIKEYNTLFELEYDFLKNFQAESNISPSKASQILISSINFLDSKVEYKKPSELNKFHQSPLFSRPPFKISLGVRCYLWAFFNNRFVFRLFKGLGIAHNIQSTNFLEGLRHNPICIKIYSCLKWHERFALIKNFGFRYKCPFCGYHARRMNPIGCNFKVIYEKEIIGCGHRFAGCIKCGSTDKERLVFTYLKKINFFANTNKSILHMAPEPNLSKQFFAHKFKEYICGDFFAPGYENVYPDYVKNINILDIPYRDEYFDVVICNHVLEHVYDDIKGMSEIFRVLKKGGFAILQVPISYKLDKTYEDSSITEPKAREESFGQSDHVRIYGSDYVNRLNSVGFDVEIISNLATKYPKFGLNNKEKLFICRK